MNPVLWKIGLYVASFLTIYILSAITFLVFARLEKDKDGNLAIDPNSWHYLLCKECYGWKDKRYGEKIDYLIEHRISLCNYFWHLFWACFMSPIIFVFVYALHSIKLFIYAPFMFLFGYYPKPGVDFVENSNLFAVNVGEVPSPQIGKFTVRPFVWVLPITFGVLYWFFPHPVVVWTIRVLKLILIVIVVASVFIIHDMIKETKNKRVKLVFEFIKAVHRGVCPLLKVKQPTN